LPKILWVYLKIPVTYSVYSGLIFVKPSICPDDKVMNEASFLTVRPSQSNGGHLSVPVANAFYTQKLINVWMSLLQIGFKKHGMNAYDK
jgi:hypothetical protein